MQARVKRPAVLQTKMCLARLLIRLLCFAVAAGLATGVESGCPQTNDTCVCNGDRVVLRVASVVLSGAGATTPQTLQHYALMELAFNQINADDSFLPGVQLENVWGFYASDDRKSIFKSITKVAATPGLITVFGGTSSEASQIIQLVASAGSIPQISSSANSPLLSNKESYPTFMRTSLVADTSVKAAVDFVVDKGWTEVVVVVEESDASIQDLKQFISFAQESTLAGRTLRVGLQLTVRPNGNHTAAVHQFLSSDLYAVVFFSALPQFVSFMSTAILDGRLGPEHNFICFGVAFLLGQVPFLGARGEVLMRSYGLHPSISMGTFYNATSGIIGMISRPGNTPATAEFQQILRTANRTLYPAAPAVFAVSHQLTVDAVYTIAHGVRHVISQMEGSNWTTCQLFGNVAFNGTHLYKAMVGSSFVGTSGNVSYDADGNRIGSIDIINLVSVGNADGSVTPSRVRTVVTHTWDYSTRSFTLQEPLTWRDGSQSPPWAPPISRRVYPPPPSPPPAPIHFQRHEEKQTAWIWGVSFAATIVFLLILNGLWLLRHVRQKQKAWQVDVGSIRWGLPKAVDCGTVICDAAYKGSDVTVRRVPLTQKLLASFGSDASNPLFQAVSSGVGMAGVGSGREPGCTHVGPCVRVRSSFHVFFNEVIKCHAPRPFFDDEPVHVHLCVEGEPSGVGARGGEDAAEGPTMVDGGGPDTPRYAFSNGGSSSIAMEDYPPLPRELKRAVLKGTQKIILDGMEMHHPNIERVLGGGVTRDSVYVLLERLTGGSLHAAIQNKTLDLEGGVVVSLLLEMAAAMKYLHSQRPVVVFGDLNPKSLFLDDHMSLKMSSVSPFYLLNSTLGKGTVPFTLEYAAPEVLAGKPPSPASDSYSFGMAIWECFARTDVYMDLSPKDIVQGVLNGTVRPKPIAPMPPDLECLMYDCLSPWPQRRPTSEEIHAQLLSIYEAKGGLQRFSTLTTKLTAQEALIDKIMPPHVAAALHRGESVPPERHESVTIMFSDIVGFTSHSAKLLPIEVMQMLDRLYTRFDKLTVKHGLFKVETIGDAYMVVGNLHPKAQDHTARIVRFAQDAIAVANTVAVKLDDPSMGTIHIRTGVHTGPVVASVVGTLNPRYCLFGDTVNMTSRIETSSQPDCVHLSQAAAVALRRQDPSLRTVRRGKVMLKGKGETTTYWLEASLDFLPEGVRAEMQRHQQRRDTRASDVSLSDNDKDDSSNLVSRDSSDYQPGKEGSGHLVASPAGDVVVLQVQPDNAPPFGLVPTATS